MSGGESKEQRIAAAVLRSSFIVFLGSLGMMCVTAVYGNKTWFPAVVGLYGFAVLWQVLNVVLNPRRVFSWLMLLFYVGLVAIPLIFVAFE